MYTYMYIQCICVHACIFLYSIFTSMYMHVQCTYVCTCTCTAVHACTCTLYIVHLYTYCISLYNSIMHTVLLTCASAEWLYNSGTECQHQCMLSRIRKSTWTCLHVHVHVCLHNKE